MSTGSWLAPVRQWQWSDKYKQVIMTRRESLLGFLTRPKKENHVSYAWSMWKAYVGSESRAHPEVSAPQPMFGGEEAAWWSLSIKSYVRETSQRARVRERT